MMISRSTYSAEPMKPNPLREAEAVSDFEPSLIQSLGANIEQGFTEMGAMSVFEGIAVGSLEGTGTPITEQDYKNSPNFRPQTPYYKGMTKESAERLAEHNDNKAINQRITENANTYGVGTAAYIAGMIAEPVNLLTGVATMGVGNAVLATKTAAHLSKVSRVGARVGAYGVEGMVGAALAEPLNRFGADMLHEDYTMADSALNIVSNTLLSGLLGAGGHFMSERAKFRGEQKAFDLAKEELDVATMQMVEGKQVDIDAVKAMRDGDITLKPIDEKAAIAEEFVRYTETPEFKARFEGSKIVDEAGAPLRVYHGTVADFDKFNASEGLFGTGVYFTKNADEAGKYAEIRNNGSGGNNLRLAYLDIKNPIDGETWKKISVDDAAIAEAKQQGYTKALAHAKTIKAQQMGYDGRIVGDNIVAFSPNQVISAFGADDLDAITARIAKQNDDIIKNTVAKASDPVNSTVYDKQSIAEIEDYIKNNPNENYSDDLMQYEEEISAMKEQGLLSDEDLAALEYLDTINEEDMLKGYEAVYFCLTKG